MKLKYALTEVDQRLNGQSLPLMSVSKIQGVVPRSDLMGDSGRAESIDHYKKCLPGDLVINRMAAYQGAVGIAPIEGAVSPDYTVVRGPRELVNFLFYFLKSELGLGLVTSLLKGIGSTDSGAVRTPRLNWKDMAEVSMEFAPGHELVEAVNYLDQETAQIDLLISKKEQLIDKLLERRQALITQAVTKGLDPNVPMKDSGVEWIGAMPRDFELDKASRFFNARKGSSAALLSVEYCAAHPGQYPVYSGQTENGGVMAEIDTFEFDFHEKPVLFTTTVGSSKVMSVDLLSGRFSLSQNCMILVPTSEDKLLTKYAFWMLQALFLEKKKELSAHMQLSFRKSDFYGYRLIVPPAETQREVASYLETETKKIEQITSAAISAITLLKERRQALVTQVVTGKLDVRGFAGGNS